MDWRTALDDFWIRLAFGVMVGLIITRALGW